MLQGFPYPEHTDNITCNKDTCQYHQQNKPCSLINGRLHYQLKTGRRCFLVVNAQLVATNMKSITPRMKIGISNHRIISRLHIFVIKSFKFIFQTDIGNIIQGLARYLKSDGRIPGRQYQLMFIQYRFLDKSQRIKGLNFRIIHKHAFYEHIILHRLLVQFLLGYGNDTCQSTDINIVVGRNVQPSVIHVIQGKITLPVIVLECGSG